MIKEKDNYNFGKLVDLLGAKKQRKIPIVSKNTTLDEIIDAFARSAHSRLIYVVDDAKKIAGVISLGDLIRHVFFHYHEQHQYIDKTQLIKMATCETANDFMKKEPLVATTSDNIEDVLEKMIKYNAKEIPVVDNEKRIVADLTMVDFLKYCKSEVL